MTQRRKSKKTEAEPRRVNRRTFLAGAGAAACVGAGLWLRRKMFSKRDKTKAEKQPVENPALPAGEWRAVWVSYLEWAAMDFSSADAFRAGCVQMLENCAGLGLNTVLAQVRPFGDALYKSQLFPWSHLCTGVQGQDPGFDPLDILLQEAHGRGLSVEAWLNPYRLLTGQGGTRQLWLEGERIGIRRCIVSVTLQKAQVLVRLDCQRAAHSPLPTQAQRQQLAAQCTALLQSCWQQGVDVLHLQARAALRSGSGASFDPTKNACPQWRTDVHFMLY